MDPELVEIYRYNGKIVGARKIYREKSVYFNFIDDSIIMCTPNGDFTETLDPLETELIRQDLIDDPPENVNYIDKWAKHILN